MEMKIFSRFSLVFSSLLIVLPLFTSGQGKVMDYIEKYHDLAIDIMHETGIPASVILATAIHETGAGTSRNCKALNNHFGIKNIRRQRVPQSKRMTAYKLYPSDTASYRHFAEKLMKQKFYDYLKDNNDYLLWIKTIGKSGYARAYKSWKRSILRFIEKYDLNEFDWM